MMLLILFLSLFLTTIPLQASPKNNLQIIPTQKQKNLYQSYGQILTQKIIQEFRTAIQTNPSSLGKLPETLKKELLECVRQCATDVLQQDGAEDTFYKLFPSTKVKRTKKEDLETQVSNLAQQVANELTNKTIKSVIEETTRLQQEFFWKKYLFLGGTALLLAALLYYQFNSKMNFSWYRSPTYN